MAHNLKRVVDFVGESFIITFPYDIAQQNELKKTVPGAHWNKPNWVVPEFSRDFVAKFAVSAKLVPTDSAMAQFEQIGKQNRASEASIAASKSLDSNYTVKGLKLDLRPFQRAGVKYAIEHIEPNKGIYFGDEMGLGKTPEMLATLHQLKAWPVLVCCPPKVWVKWAKEVHKWVPNRKVVLLAGTTTTTKTRDLAERYGAKVCIVGDKLPKADVYVVSHPNLAKWVKPRFKYVGGSKGGKKRKVVGGATGPLFDIKWKAWAFDEAQVFKSEESARSKAAQGFAISSHAPWKLMASGTPNPNARGREFLVCFRMINRIQDIARNEWEFLIRYCGGHQGDFGWEFEGATNPEELNDKMRVHFFVQRDKKDVFPELPPVQPDIVDAELSNQRDYSQAHAAWRAARTDFSNAMRSLEWARSSGKDVKHWQKIAEALGKKVGVAMQEALRACGVGKIDFAIKWLEDFLEETGDGKGGGAKIIVVGIQREVNETLSDYFGAPLIYGGTTPANQDEAESAFMEDPRCRIIVIHPEAGGVGLNLTAATHVAFIELPFRSIDFDQTIGRAYGRMNDLHGVNAYIFINPSPDPTIDNNDSADEHVWYDLVVPKAETLKVLISGEKLA